MVHHFRQCLKCDRLAHQHTFHLDSSQIPPRAGYYQPGPIETQVIFPVIPAGRYFTTPMAVYLNFKRLVAVVLSHDTPSHI